MTTGTVATWNESQCVCFVNPFTERTEHFIDPIQANSRMLTEAANRIAEIREEMKALRTELTTTVG